MDSGNPGQRGLCVRESRMEMTLEHFGIPRLLTLQNQGTERAPGLTDGEEIRMEGKYPRFQLQKARGCAG